MGTDLTDEPLGTIREGSCANQRLLTPEQAASWLSIGRTKVYELMSAGVLGSVRIGASRRIPVAALDEFVQHLRDTTV
jgi:excisionase family DNA binding protein